MDLRIVDDESSLLLSAEWNNVTDKYYKYTGSGMTRDMSGVVVTKGADKGEGGVPFLSIAEAGERKPTAYIRASESYRSTSQRAAVYPLIGLRMNAFVMKVSLSSFNAVSREYRRIPPNFRYRYRLHDESMISRFAGAANLAQFFELGRKMSVLKARVGTGLFGAYRLLTVLKGAAFELKEVHKSRKVTYADGSVKLNVRYVHHDIKPSNFVVDGKDKVSLIDWELTVQAGDEYMLISEERQKEAAEKKSGFEHCGPERFQQGSTGATVGVARCADDMYGFVEMLTKTRRFIESESACFNFHKTANDILTGLIDMCGSKDLDDRPSAEELYDAFNLLRKESFAYTSKPIDIPVRTRTTSAGLASLAKKVDRSSGLPSSVKSSEAASSDLPFSGTLTFSREEVPGLEGVRPLSLLFSAVQSPVSSVDSSSVTPLARSFSDTSCMSISDLSGSSKEGSPRRVRSLVDSPIKSLFPS